ncbi:MAG: MATE family efflux transporter [Haloarculaceae archaeon]
MDFGRPVHVWRRVFDLAWPVMAEQTTRTAMRTTDVLITAAFSPAAVVAIGLADLYGRFPLRIGLGLGGGVITLSSQDTGAGATTQRDEAVTQALLLGFLVGIPFVFFGLLLGDFAIAVFGASEEVVGLGSIYLAIVFATAPIRHVNIVGARALQGTGDTKTPMYINVLANVLNITGSVTLGLGLFGLPRLEIIGVALATASANLVTASFLVAAIYGTWTETNFLRPRDLTIAKQLVQVSAPRVAEGIATELAAFPFNALLLGFGEAVNAGFQIGRRIFQQVTGPLSRGYNVAASVLVGQSLGDGLPDDARYIGWAVTGLGIVTICSIGLGLAFFAEWTVGLFTDDPATAAFGADFARVYGLSAAAFVTFSTLAGSLQGGSEARIPFVARVTGRFGFFLGFSWLVGRTLGYGTIAAYAGIFLAYLWMALVVSWGFGFTGWAARAASMMAERGSIDDSDMEADIQEPDG